MLVAAPTLAALALLLASSVVAREPTCATLICDAEQRAQRWLAAAQDEAVVLLQTLFGGFGVGDAAPLINGCAQSEVLLAAPLCVEPALDFADACHTKNCAFAAHPELYHGGSVHCKKTCAPTKPWASAEPDAHVCRPVRAWASLGLEKLYRAYDLLDAGAVANATSHACVAEQLLRRVNEYLDEPFAAERVSYRHIVSEARLVAYDLASGDGDANDLVVGTRTVQSFRRARGTAANHTLVATYVLARVVERSIDEAEADAAAGGVTQLLWPVSGAVASFDRTSLPGGNECVRERAPTTVSPAFDAARALPTLGPHDFAVVADAYVRGDALPFNGDVRLSTDLRAGSDCCTVVLFADIDTPPSDARCEPERASLGYVAHRKSPFTYEANEARDPQIEATLVARVAAADMCADFEPAVVVPDAPDAGEDDAPEAPEPEAPDADEDDAPEAPDAGEDDAPEAPEPEAPDADEDDAPDTPDAGEDEAPETVGLFGAAVPRTYRSPLDGVPLTLAPGESRCVGGARAGASCSLPSECGAGERCRTTADGLAVCVESASGRTSGAACALADEREECPDGTCYGDADGHAGGAYPLLYVYRTQGCAGARPGVVCAEPEVQRWYEHPQPGSVKE